MKKFLFFFLFFINTNYLYSSNVEYKIIASINDKSITNHDLKNEFEIIKILNKKKDLDYNQFRNIALNNLIEETIKEQELEKEKSFIDDKRLEFFFSQFKNNTKIEIEKINKNYIKLIKHKIKIDSSWNNFISKKYSWRVNINMQEIENKIKQIEKESLPKEIEKIKEDLITNQKKIKLSVFSRFYLDKLKKLSLIKYY